MPKKHDYKGGRDWHYGNRTVHEKKVGWGLYKITGTTTHKGGKSIYKKKI